VTTQVTKAKQLPVDLVEAAKLGAAEGAAFFDEMWGKARGFPIDPADIATRCHIRVTRYPFRAGDNRSGWLNRETFDEIVVNANDSLETQRNTLGHELGHWYSVKRMDRAVGSCDRNKTRAADNPDDAYADNFSLALLMPENIIRAAATVGFTPKAIAIPFATTIESVNNRLRFLEII
jgi:Zn-dependent peptidase ImmA (M78 family)